MLPAKIKITDQLLNEIKAARTAKRIAAAALSRAIERDDSYISSLELKRLRTISSVDFVAIVRYLFGIADDEAMAKAEELAGIGKTADTYTGREARDSFSSPGGKGLMSVSEPGEGDSRYDAKNGYAEPELISDALDALSGLIAEFYSEDPKETVFALNSFIKTMQCDPGFAMGLMGIPFFALKTLSADERREVLDELLGVYRKYAGTGYNTRVAGEGA